MLKSGFGVLGTCEARMTAHDILFQPQIKFLWPFWPTVNILQFT